MFTNGLKHWTTCINKSEVDEPFHISDITVSDNKSKIVAYYKGNQQQFFFKTFRLSSNDVFIAYEDDLTYGKQATKNLSFDE